MKVVREGDYPEDVVTAALNDYKIQFLIRLQLQRIENGAADLSWTIPEGYATCAKATRESCGL